MLPKSKILDTKKHLIVDLMEEDNLDAH